MLLFELSATIVMQGDDDGSLMILWIEKHGRRNEYAKDDE